MNDRTCGYCRHFGPSTLHDVRDRQGAVGFCNKHNLRVDGEETCDDHSPIEQKSAIRRVLELVMIFAGFYITIYALFKVLFPLAVRLTDYLK